VPSRIADLCSKAWSYWIAALRHPASMPRIGWGVLRGAHLGSLLAITAQKKWLERAGIMTILDVGAHQGEFASGMIRVLPKARVYSFEPLPDCYEKLTKRFSGNPRIQAFNVALSDSSGKAQFWRSSFTKSSSLLAMADLHRQAFPWTATSTAIEVSMDTLDHVSGSMELVAPVLLKIDVQGAELRVLGGARQALRKIDHVVVEASFRPLYEGQPLFDDVYRFLHAEGFRLNGVWDTLHSPMDGSALQSDMLFSRMK
jgi:FkbM family methyltransferase